MVHIEGNYSSEEIADTYEKTRGDVKYHVVTLRDFDKDPIRDDDLLRDCVILSTHETIADAYEETLGMSYGTYFKCASRNGVMRELTEVEWGYIEQLDSRPDVPSMRGPE